MMMLNQENQGQYNSMSQPSTVNHPQTDAPNLTKHSKNKRSPIWIGLGIFLVGCILYALVAQEINPDYQQVFWNQSIDNLDSEKAVRVLDIQGMITYDKMVPAVENILKEVEESEWIQGLIVRINSPGGGAMASKTIHDMILNLKAKTKKPVIAVMTEVAASGGYYIACAADEIIASSATITGSIGTLMSIFNVSELFKKLGVKHNLFKSGNFKAIGADMSRDLNNKEKALLQSLIQEFYTEFFENVYQSRRKKINRQTLKTYADGRVFTGKTALKIGLIDRNGYMSDAIELMQKKLKVKELAIIQDKKINFSLLKFFLQQTLDLGYSDIMNLSMQPLYLYTANQFK